MPEAKDYPTSPFKLSNTMARQGMSLQAKIYIVRTLFCLTVLALLAINDVLCRGQPGDHPWLLAIGLLYPHIGHLLFGRLDVSRRRGHLLFMADGLFVGAVTGALEFAMMPSLVLVVISLFNWMVVGGPILVLLGSTFMLTGMLTSGASLDASHLLPGGTCFASDGLAVFIAIGYFLIVAGIIHRLVGELRLQQVEFQARTDSASTAQTMAEQALLAVLPPSAAQKMADTGDCPAEHLPAATVLLLELTAADAAPPTLDDIKEALPLCNAILERHGLELLKTFGQQAIALSRKESGPDDAFKAFLEIDIHFRNLGGQLAPDSVHLSVRAVLHVGNVTVGLVHPERLNLDLFGNTMKELGRLMKESAELGEPGLIVSASAYLHLKQPAGLKPIHPDQPESTNYLLRS